MKKKNVLRLSEVIVPNPVCILQTLLRILDFSPVGHEFLLWFGKPNDPDMNMVASSHVPGNEEQG